MRTIEWGLGGLPPAAGGIVFHLFAALQEMQTFVRCFVNLKSSLEKTQKRFVGTTMNVALATKINVIIWQHRFFFKT